jgi:hypothetical protein
MLRFHPIHTKIQKQLYRAYLALYKKFPGSSLVAFLEDTLHKYYKWTSGW